jgi:rhodanese-related sulfurtransferase
MTTIELSKSKKVKGSSPTFEICRQAADTYLNAGKPLYITAKDLCSYIAETSSRAIRELEYYDPLRRTEGPFIVDLRSPDSEMHELYYCGHIPGAIHIPWRQITQLKYLSSLPKDRRIIVYSNNGQTGGQVAAILSILGYDAVNLKWGMTSWTRDQSSAPERFDKERDIIWQNGTYRNTTTANLEQEEIYPLPNVHSNGQSPSAIIWSVADTYLRDFKPSNISVNALYDPYFSLTNPLSMSPYEEDDKEPLVLPFGAPPGKYDEPFTWPFVLDVRNIDSYSTGHIPGCLHIDSKEVFKLENLKKLPPDRQIIVCSETGHTSAHVVALLNILGYDAINLKWGMSSWSFSLNGDGDNLKRYSAEKDCMGYPIVKGWNPGQATECKA